MDRIMNDPIEHRVKALELKIEFLENWKNTPFIQVTLPVILSIFLATSWVNFGLTQMDKRIDAIEKRMDRLESRMDRLENRMSSVENLLVKIDQRLSKIEAKLGI